MSNGSAGPRVSVSVPAGGTTRASLTLPTTHVCQIGRTITFPTSRSFVEPIAENLGAFSDLLTRLAIPATTHNRLLITGHTDSPGDASLNQALSERRARSVQAVLQNDVAAWESLFGSEGWGSPELTQMVTTVGETDISPYQGAAGAARRADLFRRYFVRLLAGRTVPPGVTTTPPLLACGEGQLLRGDPLHPSRDPALPPIEGDFRPNRRSEFFFFDSTPTPIACPEYPTWRGLCSLTPPAPVITVTFASLDSVPKGGTADVQVTVSPSPLPFGTRIRLTLTTTSGTGVARFADNDSLTLDISGSGPVTLRGVTESSGIDNIRLSASVAGRPGTLAQEDFTVTDTVMIFLQFEVWNLTTHLFEPLPAGVDVDIMDHDPVSFNDPLAAGQTDARGRVFFNLPGLTDPDESEPDIFFLVHTNGRSHAGHSLPSEWSTRGWKASDGTPGSIDDYTGSPIGSLPGSPRVFRIGLDFHARFTYLNGRTSSDERAPKEIPVQLLLSSGTVKADRTTDDEGEVHGVIFDIDPGEDIRFRLFFRMTDASLNLPTARVSMIPNFWNTAFPDSDRKDFPGHDRTSIGTHGSPEVFRLTQSERNVALYFLKIVRELAIFLFRITNGDWQGVRNLTLFRRSISGVAYSWPVGEVNIPPSDHFDRSTIVHELSHQIMWQEVNISSLGVAYEFIFGDLAAYHQVDLLSNTQHALIEGWAEFMEAVFAGTSTPPYSVSSVHDEDGNVFPLGPPPANRGESVEGAFANGLWAIFERHVVTPAVAANAHVPESPNGNIMATTAGSYLSSTAVRTRFLSMIWNPFKDMSSLSNPASTDMLANIRTRNLPVWHALHPELQAFNMAMASPTVTSIDPRGGPPSGGTAVTIRGTNFILGGTRVTIGGVPATSITVTATDTLTAVTPPGPVGSASVIVATNAGISSGLVPGFTYALPPVVTLVELTAGPSGPARGPTTGGTQVTITGRDFHPDAEVFFGGLPPAGVPATDIFILSATEIEAKSPRFPLPGHSPGGVAVVVRNPDGQTGSLDPGFDYFLLPAPHITLVDPVSGPAAGGTEITIDGANFQAGVAVFLQGREAPVDLTRTNDARIVAETPALPFIALPGPVLLQVVNPDGQEASVPGGFTYTL